MPTIQHSVGDRVTNDPDDVRVVQQLIREWRERPYGRLQVDLPWAWYAPLPAPAFPPPVDGIVRPNLIRHIREFQRQIAEVRPTGIVRPGSPTLFALNGMSGGPGMAACHPAPMVRRMASRYYTTVRYRALRSDRLEGESGVEAGHIVRNALTGGRDRRTWVDVPAWYEVVRVRVRTDEQHLRGLTQTDRLTTRIVYEWGRRTPTVEVVEVQTETGSTGGNRPRRRTVRRYRRHEVWRHVTSPDPNLILL